MGIPCSGCRVIIAFILGGPGALEQCEGLAFVIMFTYTLCGVLNAVYVKVTGKQAVFK